MLTLLDGADSRMAEIEARSVVDEDMTIPCFDVAAMEATSELTFPGDKTFEMHLNCQDKDLGLSFGTKDNSWYIREGKPSTVSLDAAGAGAHVFKITPENVVSGYIWLPSKDGSFDLTTMLLHVYADRPNGTVEVTGGGIGTGFCSFHYRSDANYIYILSNISGVGYTCDSDGNGTTDSSDWAETCLTSSLASSDATNCASLKSGLTLTTLGRAASLDSAGNTWEAAPVPASGSLTTFELKDYLLALFEAAGTVNDAIGAFGSADK